MRKSDLVSIISFALAIMCMAGCAKEDSHDPAPANAPAFKDQSAGPEAAATPAEPPRVVSPFEGNWQSTCVKARLFGISETAMAFYEPTRVKLTTITSREADCGFRDIEIVQESGFTRGPSESNPPGTEVLELARPTVRVKALSPVGASTLRIREFCGIKDWTIGVERDVSAVANKGAKNCVAPLLKKQVWVLKDSKLYLGGPEVSPSTLTTHPQYFVRQEERGS